MHALRLVDQAIAIADATGESWCNAALHRDRGELLLHASGVEAENQADAEFKVAIETSASQRAKLPELRASIARARLHATRGGRQEAREILAPICAWFSEGLETPDLVEARAVLAHL